MNFKILIMILEVSNGIILLEIELIERRIPMCIPYGGKYICINGSEIIDIPGSNKPEFWEHSKYSEEEYKSFINNSQDFFDAYTNKKNYENYKIDSVDASYVYIHCGNCIVVKQTPDGYICGDNGKHRCAVAKKYNLRILVCVL